MSPVDPLTISSIEEFLEQIRRIDDGTPRWFRGQIDANWRLEPGLARNRGWLENETDMLKRFQQMSASRLRERPTSEWEWLCLAQHHGLPTRLLDWSENPLIGLYFAVERDSSDPTSGPTDGCLFAISPTGLNQETYGQSTGTLLLGRDEVLNDYLPSRTPTQKRGSLAVIAPQGFDRIVAQSGVFTLTHRLDLQDLRVLGDSILETWMIPSSAKERLRNELDLLNVNASTVYPDLSHISVRIRTQSEG